MAKSKLKAPFPYPGGKSKVAADVWERLGDVANYVEPFAGSLAMLLKRPAEHFANGYRVETVNDASHYLVNFWRAVQRDPDAVAYWADSPVFEADLHARHKWLMRGENYPSADTPYMRAMQAENWRTAPNTIRDWRKRMAEDPDAFDAKIAGWWVWGQCCWIGGAWCVGDMGRWMGEKPAEDEADSTRRPSMSFNNLGPGVRGNDPSMSGGNTDHGQRLPLSQNGWGVNAQGRPQLTDAFDIGRGVNSSAKIKMPRSEPIGVASADHKKRPNFPENGIGLGVLKESTQIPNLSGDGGAFGRGVRPGGTCDIRRAWLTQWMRDLSDRLRLVRTCYGHWSRICDSDSTMTRLGVTGVFLDPPYPALKADGSKSRDDNLYVNDKHQDLNALRDEVLAWCRKWSGPKVRIVVCGYEGDGYEALVAEGWTEQAWEAGGGYANQRRGGKGKAENAKRERIWYSPACVKPANAAGLFDTLSGDASHE